MKTLNGQQIIVGPPSPPISPPITMATGVQTSFSSTNMTSNNNSGNIRFSSPPPPPTTPPPIPPIPTTPPPQKSVFARNIKANVNSSMISTQEHNNSSNNNTVETAMLLNNIKKPMTNTDTLHRLMSTSNRTKNDESASNIFVENIFYQKNLAISTDDAEDSLEKQPSLLLLKAKSILSEFPLTPITTPTISKTINSNTTTTTTTTTNVIDVSSTLQTSSTCEESIEKRKLKRVRSNRSKRKTSTVKDEQLTTETTMEKKNSREKQQETESKKQEQHSKISHSVSSSPREIEQNFENCIKMIIRIQQLIKKIDFNRLDQNEKQNLLKNKLVVDNILSSKIDLNDIINDDIAKNNDSNNVFDENVLQQNIVENSNISLKHFLLYLIDLQKSVLCISVNNNKANPLNMSHDKIKRLLSWQNKKLIDLSNTAGLFENYTTTTTMETIISSADDENIATTTMTTDPNPELKKLSSSEKIPKQSFYNDEKLQQCSGGQSDESSSDEELEDDEKNIIKLVESLKNSMSAKSLSTSSIFQTNPTTTTIDQNNNDISTTNSTIVKVITTMSSSLITSAATDTKTTQSSTELDLKKENILEKHSVKYLVNPFLNDLNNNNDNPTMIRTQSANFSDHNSTNSDHIGNSKNNSSDNNSSGTLIEKRKQLFKRKSCVATGNIDKRDNEFDTHIANRVAKSYNDLTKLESATTITTDSNSKKQMTLGDSDELPLLSDTENISLISNMVNSIPKEQIIENKDKKWNDKRQSHDFEENASEFKKTNTTSRKKFQSKRSFSIGGDYGATVVMTTSTFNTTSSSTTTSPSTTPSPRTPNSPRLTNSPKRMHSPRSSSISTTSIMNSITSSTKTETIPRNIEDSGVVRSVTPKALRPNSEIEHLPKAPEAHGEAKHLQNELKKSSSSVFKKSSSKSSKHSSKGTSTATVIEEPIQQSNRKTSSNNLIERPSTPTVVESSTSTAIPSFVSKKTSVDKLVENSVDYNNNNNTEEVKNKKNDSDIIKKLRPVPKAPSSNSINNNKDSISIQLQQNEVGNLLQRGNSATSSSLSSAFFLDKNQKKNFEDVLSRITINDVQQLEILGSGGSGTVRRVSCMGLTLACKAFPIESFTGEEKSKIQSEFKMICKLKHDNIVKYFSLDMTSDNLNYYIFMEYFSSTLKNIIILKQAKNEQRLSINLIVNFIIQMSNAIAFLHKQNTLHRDLKSENVFAHYDSANEMSTILKIGDFGESKQLKKLNQNKRYTLNIGTQEFMAPELIGETTNSKRESNKLFPNEQFKKSDIWSFGLIIFEMFTLDIPYRTSTDTKFGFIEQIVKGNRPQINIDFISQLENQKERAAWVNVHSLYELCTNKEPDDRPTSKNIVDLILICNDLLIKPSAQ